MKISLTPKTSEFFTLFTAAGENALNVARVEGALVSLVGTVVVIVVESADDCALDLDLALVLVLFFVLVLIVVGIGGAGDLDLKIALFFVMLLLGGLNRSGARRLQLYDPSASRAFPLRSARRQPNGSVVSAT